MIRTMAEIKDAMAPLPPLTGSTARTAAEVIGGELDRLEELAAQIVTVRNVLRLQARDLYTAQQVGDYQTSEAELVSTALRRDLERTRREHAEAMAADHRTIVEQRALIDDMTAQRDRMAVAARRAQDTSSVLQDRLHEMAGDIARLNAELGRRYTMAQVEDVRSEAVLQGRAEGRAEADELLRRAVERLSHLEDPSLILAISNHLGKSGASSPRE